MINVLISAYAVSPTWGSEPGVGWNWIVNIAKYCNVFVITESEWKEDIFIALETIPHKDNIHFFFNPVSNDVRNMCWNQGDWRFYKHYRVWQKKTLEIAKKIIHQNHIDVIHQLNMIGFREPGYLWTIENIPFVWGPIGNMSPVPLSYLKGSSVKEKLKLLAKNSISYIQARTGRVRKTVLRSDCLITVLNGTADIISNHYGIDQIEIMPETGLKVTPKVEHNYDIQRPLRILWVGRFIPTKKLDLALRVISKCDTDNIELHVVGWGSEKEERRYREMAKDYNIINRCKWYGKIPNERVQQLMRDSDIFLFTSVLEGTPHVVLEAISNNLPVVCFDLCGQGVIVNDSIGWKIPIVSLDAATCAMTEIINNIEKDRILIKKKSENCEQRKPELSWENKINSVIRIYQRVIGRNEKK